MIQTALMLCSLLLVGLTFLSFHRAVLGPTPADRIVAINVIGTKTVVALSMLAFLHRLPQFLDVCLVYALISFLATCGLAAYLEKGRIL